MNRLTFNSAKETIRSICRDADKDRFTARTEFLRKLEQHPEIAVQGYNLFGKIFYWNDASARLYGHSAAEAVNRNLIELILPPEMRQFAFDLILNAAKTGRMPEPGAFDLMHQNGEYVSVFVGHLVFHWADASTPEFYYLNYPLFEPVPAV